MSTLVQRTQFYSVMTRQKTEMKEHLIKSVIYNDIYTNMIRCRGPIITYIYKTPLGMHDGIGRSDFIRFSKKIIYKLSRILGGLNV